MKWFFGTATGRPYRTGDGGFEGTRVGPVTGADGIPLVELLLTHPDFLDSDALLWADGRVIEQSDPGRRTMIGWHRRGGPILLSVTTGEIHEADLVEAARLAEVTSGWTVPIWGEVVSTFWREAPGTLVARIVERWGLEGDRIRDPKAWGDAVWAKAPAPGPAHVGVLGAVIGERTMRAVTWLRDGGIEIAAFTLRRIESESGPTYTAERVAGGWHASPRRPLPGEDESLRRETDVPPTGGVGAALLAALEKRCLEAGGEIGWSGEEWVRFRGPAGSVRLFPGPGRVDLQLVGADEGTLTGLRFRFAVPVTREPPPGAPPGVHLRLTGLEDLTPELEMLLARWLSGCSSETNGDGEEITPDRLSPASGPARDRRERSR